MAWLVDLIYLSYESVEERRILPHDNAGLSSLTNYFLFSVIVNVPVVILSLQENLVREFMLKAHSKGLTKGDWAFLDVELFKVR